MASNISMDSMDSDVFFVEQLSNEPSPQRNNSPKIPNSMELSGTHTREMPTISSVASPVPDIVTLDDNSNDPKFSYGFGAQQPIVPPSPNDLNPPPSPFNNFATMAVVNHGHDNNYSPIHRSHLIYRPSRHHAWIWVQLLVGKFRKPQLTTTISIRRTSQDEYTGPLPWMKLSIRKANPDESTCSQLHLRRQHPARWKGSWRWECPFQKEVECRSMSAKTAEKWFPQQWTFQDRRLRTKNCKYAKTLIMKTNKPIILFNYKERIIFRHF